MDSRVRERGEEAEEVGGVLQEVGRGTPFSGEGAREGWSDGWREGGSNGRRNGAREGGRNTERKRWRNRGREVMSWKLLDLHKSKQGNKYN